MAGLVGVPVTHAGLPENVRPGRLSNLCIGFPGLISTWVMEYALSEEGGVGLLAQ